MVAVWHKIMQRNRCRHAMGKVAAAFLCLALIAGAVPATSISGNSVAHAADPFQTLDIDNTQPLLSYDMFKEFFIDEDTGEYMLNPRTEKPFSDSDIRYFWAQMLKEKPELKPFLEGKWDLLPGELKNLSSDVIRDVESTFHALFALQTVPSLSQSDISREGRRIARVFQAMGPDRLSTAIRSINKMDYFEMEVLFQAMGTSVEKLRPLIGNRSALLSSLKLLPEGNEILKQFGGVNGLLNQVTKIKLPVTPEAFSWQRVPEHPKLEPRLAQKSPTTHHRYGPGGLFGVSASMLAVLAAGADDDLPTVDPRTGLGDIATPATPYVPNATDYSFIVREDEIASEEADDEANGVSDTMAECDDDDGSADDANAQNCATKELFENEPGEGEIGGDNQPSSCPTAALGDIKQEQGCPALDTSGFEVFDSALKDANKQFEEMRKEGVGDTSKLESDMGLLANAANYATILNEYPNQGLNVVRQYKGQIEQFSQLGGKILFARSKVPEEDRAAFDLFALQHKKLLGNMRRGEQGADLVDKLDLSGAIATLGDFEKFAMPLGAMQGALGAVNRLPQLGEQQIKKMKLSQAKIGNFCIDAPSGKLINMMTKITEQDFSIKSISLPRMNGILKIISIITDILKYVGYLQKALQIIKTVKEILQMVSVIKDLAGMADDIGSMQGMATEYAEASKEVTKVQGDSAMMPDVEKLESVFSIMDGISTKYREHKADPAEKAKELEKSPGKEITDVEVKPEDVVEFRRTYEVIKNAVATGKGGYNTIASDWGSVEALYNQTQVLLTDDVFGAFQNVNLRANALVDISLSFETRSIAPFKLAAKEMPKLVGKIQSIPNHDIMKRKLDDLLSSMGRTFAKLDKYRGKVCVQIPGYTVRFCIAPFPWPVSQANLYMVIGRLMQDNRYRNARATGQIPFDYNKGLLGGVTAGLAYRAIDQMVPVGTEPLLKGVGGALPAKKLKPLDTPVVSPLDLNQGWLYRRACPRDWKNYKEAGLYTDEFDESESMFEGGSRVRMDPKTKATLPQFAQVAMLEPYLRPDYDPAYDATLSNKPFLGARLPDSIGLLKAVNKPSIPITCAPVKPKKCQQDNPSGCYSPMMRRLMVDSCANQYILTQALTPNYIADTDAKPGITSEFCQPLFLQPQSLCMKDLRGNCLKDSVDGGVRYEYDAFMYVFRAWMGTMVNDYLPDVHFPVIYDKARNYKDWTKNELKTELKKPEYRNNPDAMLVAPGIEYYYDEDPITGMAKKRGVWDMLDTKNRQQIAQYITHPYEVIVDPTHPFTPRWDFETTDREKYSQCTQFRMGGVIGPKTNADEVCGKGRIIGGALPGLGKGSGEYGISLSPFDLLKSRDGTGPAGSASRSTVELDGSVACAGTPVDILRFREKNFDDCIMCRLSVNERCMWSEPVQITITSVIIEVIRMVIYWIVYAICTAVITIVTFGLGSVAASWVGKQCGKFVRWLIDKILLDALGHNAAKSLTQAPKSKQEKKCKRKSMPGCRSIIEFYQSSLLMLRSGTTENSKHLSGNPYDTGMYRLITRTGGDDPAQFAENQAVLDFYKYQNWTWKKAYRDFKRNHRSSWIEALRPLAEEYCEKKMKKGKSPHRCDKARRKLKKGFKGALKRGKKSIFKGLRKLNPRDGDGSGEMKIPFFCKTDRTKQARKMWPPCSTSFNEPDKDENFCKKGCSVSVTDCCNELARPLIPLNKLRLSGYSTADDKPGNFPEGMTFKEYFGDHRPYMAMWDTGSEWGASGPRKDQIDYLSPAGSLVHVVGVGKRVATDSDVLGKLTKNGVYNACKIGGWGDALKDPKKFGDFPVEQCMDWSKIRPKLADGQYGPNPLTSWTELKLYQARTFRYFRLNCIGQYEKLFKPYTMEDIILKAKGGTVPIERDKEQTTIEWSAAHRGFLWDPNPEDRFPFVGAEGKSLDKKILKGLDNARSGDIVYLDAEAYKEAYKQAFPSKTDAELEKSFAPMMGIITEAVNGYDPIEKKMLEGARAPEKNRYYVELWQSNAGIHPDSCGNTEMMGFGRKRTIYRNLETLVGKGQGDDPAKSRFAILDQIQATLPSTAARVYTPLCQLDPMLRYCTLDDNTSSQTARVNLWDHMKIYRPKEMDYRGGCKVRPVAKATEDQKVDINYIPLEAMHLVPEDDIRTCMDEGRDPPKVSRSGLRDGFQTPLISSLCSPGFAGRSSSFIRSLPIVLTQGLDKITDINKIGQMLNQPEKLDEISKENKGPAGTNMWDVFPALKWRPDLRGQGCPRFASDSMMPLKVKMKVQLNLDESLSIFENLKTIHNKAIAGANGLGELYGKYMTLPKTTWNAADSLAKGKLRYMPCGGGVPLAAKDTAGPQRSSFDSLKPENSQPSWMGHKGTVKKTNMIEVEGSVIPMTLYAPPSFDRGAGGVGNEERFLSNLNVQECPGFAVNGLRADVFNLIVPPCIGKMDAGGTVKNEAGNVCKEGAYVEQPQYKRHEGLALNNGSVPLDKETTLLTPKDTLMRVQAVVEGGPIKTMKVVFPNGVSFKHMCKKMVTLNGYNEVLISNNGKLKVLKGETAELKDENGKELYHPLHSDLDSYLLRPLGAVIIDHGFVPMDPDAKVIPAINTLPSPSDINADLSAVYGDASALGNEFTSAYPDTKPGITASTLRDDMEVRPDYTSDADLQKYIDAADGDTNDVCRDQDQVTCLDGRTPTLTDRDATFAEGGADEDPCASEPASLSCAKTQGACALNSESDACKLAEEDACVAQPDGKACKDQTTFCAESPDYYLCRNKDSCSSLMGDGETDDWENCYYQGDDSCSDNPGSAACQQESAFCSKPENGENYMCGGSSSDDANMDE